MALRDLRGYLEDDGLDYPCPSEWFEDPAKFPQGKSYSVPSPSAKTGLYLTGLAEITGKAARGENVAAEELSQIRLDDDGEKSLYQRVLGPVYDEMLADGLKFSRLQQIGQDAYFCFAMSQETADAVLAGPGEARAPETGATPATAKRTAGRRSARASGATATRTRRRASTGSSTSPSGSGGTAQAI